MKESKTSPLLRISAAVLLIALVIGSNLANAKSKSCKSAMGKEMYIGADYYPEHWPKERWETDAKLMKEAGFNIVRLAEFSWIWMEPIEGRFEFDYACLVCSKIPRNTRYEKRRHANRMGRPKKQLLHKRNLPPPFRANHPCNG